MHHSVDGMIVTPLCPHRPVQFHSLQFPIVLPLASEVRILTESHEIRPLRCVSDGRAMVEGITEVRISHGGRHIRLMRHPEYNFIDTLVRKIIGRRELSDNGSDGE